jgi:uncharacterized membrane protein YfcA
MWNTNSLWFEVSVVSTLTALGTIFFGHFEEHTPKWRKVVKLFFFILITVFISSAVGRIWAFAFLGIVLLAVLYVHAVWLPSKGINGWTGEPKEKYYALRRWKKKDR